MTSTFLIFLLAGRLFGARLGGAIEIMPRRPARRVPLSYSYVEGLIDYRGAVYPVFNLAQRLGIGRAGPIGFLAEDQLPAGASGQSIILLEERGWPFGIIVDSVVKMTPLVEPDAAPAKTQGIDSRFVKGSVQDDDQEILILDFERLLHAG